MKVQISDDAFKAVFSYNHHANSEIVGIPQKSSMRCVRISVHLPFIKSRTPRTSDCKPTKCWECCDASADFFLGNLLYLFSQAVFPWWNKTIFSKDHSHDLNLLFGMWIASDMSLPFWHKLGVLIDTFLSCQRFKQRFDWLIIPDVITKYVSAGLLTILNVEKIA